MMMLFTSVAKRAPARAVKNERQVKAQGRAIASVLALRSKVLYIYCNCAETASRFADDILPGKYSRLIACVAPATERLPVEAASAKPFPGDMYLLKFIFYF